MTQILPATKPTSSSTEEGSGRLGWMVAASLAIGFVAALLLVAFPLVPVNERAFTGAALCGFAFGWAALWLLLEGKYAAVTAQAIREVVESVRNDRSLSR